MLKAGADIHFADKNGVTALHHAVRFRSPTAVKVLIEHGANVNQQCRRNGSTPLHRAVTQTGAPGTAGRAQAAREIVQLLLAAGADPSIRNKMGKRGRLCERCRDGAHAQFELIVIKKSHAKARAEKNEVSTTFGALTPLRDIP